MVRQKLPVPCSVQHQDDPWGPFSHQSVGFYMDQRQSGVRCKPNFLRTTYVIVRLAIQHARSTNDSHTKEPAKFALDFASCSSSTFQNNTVVGHLLHAITFLHSSMGPPHTYEAQRSHLSLSISITYISRYGPVRTYVSNGSFGLSYPLRSEISGGFRTNVRTGVKGTSGLVYHSILDC